MNLLERLRGKTNLKETMFKELVKLLSCFKEKYGVNMKEMQKMCLLSLEQIDHESKIKTRLGGDEE